MRRTFLALAIAGLSVVAYAAPPPGGGPPTPIDVTVTNPVLPVEVSNADPIPVSVVDEPGRTPWETRSQVLPNAGGCYGTSDCFNYSEGATYALWDLPPVPAGKRLVVQSATGLLVNGFSRINNIELGSPRGGVVFDGTKWVFGGPFQEGTSFSSAIFSAPVLAVFRSGEVPFVRVTASPGLSGYTVIVFTGYLIDET